MGERLREERRVWSPSSCSVPRPPPSLGTEPLSSFGNLTVPPGNLCWSDLPPPLSFLEKLKPEGHMNLRLRSQLPETSENKEDTGGHTSLSFRRLLTQGHIAVLRSPRPSGTLPEPIGTGQTCNVFPGNQFSLEIWGKLFERTTAILRQIWIYYGVENPYYLSLKREILKTFCWALINYTPRLPGVHLLLPWYH